MVPEGVLNGSITLGRRSFKNLGVINDADVALVGVLTGGLWECLLSDRGLHNFE